MVRREYPLFEWTAPAVIARFGLGVLLGLFLGVLLLAMMMWGGPPDTSTGTGLAILLGGVPLCCGLLGVFALRALAELVGDLYDDVAGNG